jgi:hypothetical protein
LVRFWLILILRIYQKKSYIGIISF